MKKKALFLKLLLRDIRQNMGRYFAILLIIALGVGFFAGLVICKGQMVATGDDYLRSHRMYDFMIASSLGLDEEGLARLASCEGVTAAEGSVSADVIVSETDGSEQVLKAMQMTETVNLPDLVSGRLPQAANECLVDSELYSDDMIGEKIVISPNNDEETAGMFSEREYTVVGRARSVNYINFQRGSTSLLSGKLAGFFYIPAEGFDADYFTEIYLTVDTDGQIYSDEYNEEIDALREALEISARSAADARYESIIDEVNAELSDARNEYEKGLAEFELAKEETESALAASLAELNNAQTALEEGEAALAEEESTLEAAYRAGMIDQATYDASVAVIAATKETLAASRAEWQSGMDAYEEGKAEAARAFAETEAELADAQAQIEAGEADRDAIEKPEAFVLSRDESNAGYISFDSDTSIVAGVATVFPIFFFMVAALVCMTTMTRLVQEQRTQIGVLKALGYRSGKIMGKYMLYAGSAATVGAAGGFALGTVIFPQVIWTAYGMLYGFAPLRYQFNLPLALISLGVSLICSVGTVWLVCRKEMAQMPAQAIRPTAPKAGKRIFLEYLPFLWNRLSFLVKVSLRNVFRYKKRFFMMLLGIGGCTSLLVAGLGMRDSIRGIATEQFESITVCDAEMTLAEPFDGDRQASFRADYAEQVENAYFVHKSSITMVTADSFKDTNLIVTDGSDISAFWKLADNGKALSLPERGQALINRKLSERYSLSVGDSLILRNESLREITVEISGIFDNYIDNYIFLSAETFEAGFGSAPEYNTAFLNFADSVDGHKAAELLSSEESVSLVSVYSDTTDSLSKTLRSLDYVVLLVIACAGMLAFIVLFNLTNINITERIREIATIKVLGFRPPESAAYVFRESFILTGISALIGLPLGKALHTFVMDQIDVDMIRFGYQISPLSYLLAFLLTMLFAVIVNLAIFGSIEKIDMAQSLKSVE